MSEVTRLLQNLKKHYESNRAPLSLSFDAAWLEAVPDFAKTIGDWMKEVQNEYNDVYFVTSTQESFLTCPLDAH